MYERSAIVLERYLDNLIGYSKKYNLRNNFENYCVLVEKLEKFQTNYENELLVTQEFNKALKKVKSVQDAQEELYQKSVQLEYNRNLLFNNIEAKVEDTRRCIEKIEIDVEKNCENMKDTKEALIEALEGYNEQRQELSKAKRYKSIAENEYNDIYQTAEENFDEIYDDDVIQARQFAKFDDVDEIIEQLEENGKDEKIPFNEDVIENATNFAVDNAKKIALSYITIYEKMEKLMNDINEGTTRIELHKKYLRNEKAKVDFLIAVREYIVQFLDYERMTVVHGRKSHNRLMREACENFAEDIVQINNLFELLLKEISNKATKKMYKDLYNKSYLKDIQEKEEKFKKEKNRVNLNTATLLNSNYWRIEGIKNIYTIFYKNVSEVFGKDVAEFELIKDEDEDSSEDFEKEEMTEEIEIIDDNNVKAAIPFLIGEEFLFEEDSEENKKTEKSPKGKKIVEESNEDDEEDNEEYIVGEENEDSEDEEDSYVSKESRKSDDIEFDIFGEKYQEIDFSEISKKIDFENTQVNNVAAGNFNVKVPKFENKNENNIFGSYIENDSGIENDFQFTKSTNRNKNSGIEDINLAREEENSLIKKMRRINKVKRFGQNENKNDIW